MKDPLQLGTDGILLFITRYMRLFGFGLISFCVPLYMQALGFSAAQIGLLMTLTLAGDLLISLPITSHADRIGRRRMLMIGAVLMALSGVAFMLTGNFILLIIASTIGVISPSGNEIGPFLSIEQASLSEIVSDSGRTRVFAWYNLAGSFATALGALSAGWGASLLQKGGMTSVASFKVIIAFYVAVGIAQLVLFSRVSPRVETVPSAPVRAEKTETRGAASNIAQKLGLRTSGKIILKLSALFSLDAFAGGFVVMGMITIWFKTRYGIDPGFLGSIIFGANILAGISSLLAVRIANRFGLINTMVFTHIPSNILLMLVPLMPNLSLAVAMLFLRYSISQMDVPTRQSYVMSVVPPGERAAAAGVTSIARTVGATISPGLSGLLLGSAALLSFPFFIGGGLKIVYDLLLYRSFKASERGKK